MNSKHLIVNQSNSLAMQLSVNIDHDFSVDEKNPAGYNAHDFTQSGFNIQFLVKGIPFSIHTVG